MHFGEDKRWGKERSPAVQLCILINTPPINRPHLVKWPIAGQGGGRGWIASRAGSQ